MVAPRFPDREGGGILGGGRLACNGEGRPPVPAEKEGGGIRWKILGPSPLPLFCEGGKLDFAEGGREGGCVWDYNRRGGPPPPPPLFPYG